jgi:hypothetical protein
MACRTQCVRPRVAHGRGVLVAGQMAVGQQDSGGRGRQLRIGPVDQGLAFLADLAGAVVAQHRGSVGAGEAAASYSLAGGFRLRPRLAMGAVDNRRRGRRQRIYGQCTDTEMHYAAV